MNKKIEYKISYTTIKSNDKIIFNDTTKTTNSQLHHATHATIYSLCTFCVLLCAMFLLLAASSFALELGLTPGDVNFDHVLSGGYAEMPFTLSTDSQDNITINLFHLNDSAVNDWITYDPSPEYITLSQAKSFSGKVIVRVPASAASGTYTISNKFTVLRPLTKSDSDTTADIALSMGQKIQISVVSDKVFGCTIYSDSLQTQSVVGQSVVETLFLRNDGNVNLDDFLNYTIFDTNQTRIISQGQVPLHVLPTQVTTLPVSLPTTNLPAGQYAVSVSVDKCAFVKSNLQFTLFAAGEKFVKGELTSVVLPVRVYNTTNTTIVGTFANTGDVDVTAHMINTLILGGHIVNVVESQPTFVPMGQTVSFENAMQTKEWGKYQIDSYVVYDSYQTPKTTAYVNFIDESSAGANNSSSINFFGTPLKIIILCVVVVLVILIIARKSKRPSTTESAHHGKRN